MSHLRRENAPKNWPIKKKGTAYIIKSGKDELPILIALRDILKVANNRSEIKKAIFKKEIIVCGKIIRDEKLNLKLFDVLTINSSKKNYRVVLSKEGKFEFKKIDEDEKDFKIVKIINKKILKNKKIQLNLGDGRNILSETKCKINDSLLINLKNNKIERCLPLKEDSKVLIISGKHIGEEATIKRILDKFKMIELEIQNKIAKVLIKQIIVIK